MVSCGWSFWKCIGQLLKISLIFAGRNQLDAMSRRNGQEPYPSLDDDMLIKGRNQLQLKHRIGQREQLITNGLITIFLKKATMPHTTQITQESVYNSLSYQVKHPCRHVRWEGCAKLPRWIAMLGGHHKVNHKLVQSPSRNQWLMIVRGWRKIKND